MISPSFRSPLFLVKALILGLTLASLVPDVARGQAAHDDDPLRFAVWIRDDVVDIGRSLVSPRPLALTGGITLIGVLSAYDEPLSERALELRNRELVRIIDNFGQADTVRPLAFGVFLGTLMQSNARVQDAAFTSFESILLANFATNFLKFVVGRARPYESTDADRFKPFSGRTSFPSGHTTTVFAAITPWFLYFPNAATIGGMVLATGTGVGRVVLGHHWPTDIVGGAFVGLMTSWWLVKNHTSGVQAGGLEPVIGPNTLGLRLTWRQ